jgi:hypothetical protein
MWQTYRNFIKKFPLREKSEAAVLNCENQVHKYLRWTKSDGVFYKKVEEKL